jgi:hypothetical protein
MSRHRRFGALPSALLIAALLAGPSLARADDASDRELGEGLTIAGLSVFVSTYALTGLSATTLVLVANTREATILESWMPLVGPWIMLGDSAGFNDLQIGLVVASGVLQTLSVGALIAGLVLMSEAGPAPSPSARGPSITLEPIASGGTLGLCLRGAF